MAQGIDSDLWRESQQFGQELKSRAIAILSGLGVNLGGGGFYPMLYFVTRYLKPDCIVETGVAAGYSSQSFLAAIRQNGKGRLHSSDFPLFRLRRPEHFIGILGEEPLKAYWDLHVNGDEANLPLILSRVQQVDVFHFDSDKSYSGRALAMSLIGKKMSEQGLVIMDDVQDNSFFYDYTLNNNVPAFSIFDFEGKYIGLIGSVTPP
jgi:predicted O-methyltransferase YrrM